MPDDLPLQYRVSNRARRLSIRIDPVSRTIMVTHPVSISERRARAFAIAHRDWIIHTLATFPERPALGPQSVLMLNDRMLTLIHTPGQRSAIIEKDDRLLIGGSSDSMGARALIYARHHADLTLPGQLDIWARIMACTPADVRCREVKSRWGSCTRVGRIMLNWRLVLMPKSVRDYVIVHELAHLAHFDHSPAFWHRVECFCPERRTAQAWLKEQGPNILALG